MFWISIGRNIGNRQGAKDNFHYFYIKTTINMKTIVPILLVLFLSSCNAVKVNYDYDKETDFSSYTTYSYYPDMETGLSALDVGRLTKAIDSTMRGKGILLSEEPEFYIALVGR